MKVIVAAGLASMVAMGGLGYVAGARSAAGAAPDPVAVSAFDDAPLPVASRGFVVRPVSYEPAAAAAPAVIREAPAQVEPKRSWKKTAIVIGAGAGSGAVVGGIVDGKKGAAIGAAIGGGAASVYEVLKRR